MRQSFAIPFIAAVTVGGCATVPQPIAGKDFATMTPQQAASQNARGERVRWGGEIISVDTKPDSTCFEILSRELYSDARPNGHDASGGRFIACGKGFYDPEVYTKGREMTIVGQVTGTEQHQVGDYNYTYARVDTDGVYLWPHRDYYYGGYDPWLYAYDPFWNPWWWGPPVVIVHHHH